MRRGAGIIAAGALFAATTLAQRKDGVVQWGIQRRQPPPETYTRVRKRASTFEEIITNEEARGGYFATCRLGTPGQDLTLQLDTGSSDIWVPDPTAKVCSKSGTEGCALGTCTLELPDLTSRSLF